MALRFFEVNSYNIFLLNKFLIYKNGITITARGLIICDGDNVQQLRVYFLADESPEPDPFVDNGGKRVQIFLPFQMMHNWQEVLRNEKPIYALFDSDDPRRSYITTLSEPVGEEES